MCGLPATRNSPRAGGSPLHLKIQKPIHPPAFQPSTKTAPDKQKVVQALANQPFSDHAGQGLTIVFRVSRKLRRVPENYLAPAKRAVDPPSTWRPKAQRTIDAPKHQQPPARAADFKIHQRPHPCQEVLKNFFQKFFQPRTLYQKPGPPCSTGRTPPGP